MSSVFNPESKKFRTKWGENMALYRGNLTRYQKKILATGKLMLTAPPRPPTPMEIAMAFERHECINPKCDSVLISPIKMLIVKIFHGTITMHCKKCGYEEEYISDVVIEERPWKFSGNARLAKHIGLEKTAIISKLDYRHRNNSHLANQHCFTTENGDMLDAGYKTYCVVPHELLLLKVKQARAKNLTNWLEQSDKLEISRKLQKKEMDKKLPMDSNIKFCVNEECMKGEAKGMLNIRLNADGYLQYYCRYCRILY